MRLRQVCLVAETLEPTVTTLSTLLDAPVCYRDPGVGFFGLENALLPVGTDFLEVVAPVKEDTAASRHLALQPLPLAHCPYLFLLPLPVPSVPHLSPTSS